MSFKFMGTKAEPITREFANKVRDMPAVAKERKLKPARIEFHKSLILRGAIRPYEWAFAQCEGVCYRVNGGHSSYALSDALMLPIPPGAVALVSRYVCPMLDGLHELWMTYDAQESARSAVENLNVFLHGKESFEGLPRNFVNVAMSALVLDRWGEGLANRVDKAAKFAVLEQNADFVLWTASLPQLRVATHFCFRRAGVAYAMLRTYRVSPAAATEFWSDVATQRDARGATVEAGSPAAQLRDFLISTDTRSGAGARSGRPAVQWDEMARKCLTAWNLWRRGQTLSKLVLPKHMPEAV